MATKLKIWKYNSVTLSNTISILINNAVIIRYYFVNYISKHISEIKWYTHVIKLLINRLNINDLL